MAFWSCQFGETARDCIGYSEPDSFLSPPQTPIAKCETDKSVFPHPIKHHETPGVSRSFLKLEGTQAAAA